jgi:polyisoprenyl-teichoic acid--peptidoglycan teichoic acid transferase
MKRRKKKAPIWFRLVGGLCYLLVCALTLGVGSLAGYMGNGEVTGRMVQDFFTKGRQAKVGDADVFEARDGINLLLLGCDVDLSIGGKKVLQRQARSDMMLVAHLDFKTNRITGLSIQRDTLAQVPGYREQKINGFHAIGVRKSDEEGKELAKQAVESILPIKIDRVLVLNYDALQEMVGLVGGVDVFVDKKMDYDDNAGNLHIHFKPGKHHLDGYEAMAFVRFRHSDDDFHRTERQRQFLMAFKEAVIQNPGAISAVADKAREGIGNGLTPSEIIALAGFARGVSQDNIRIGGVPVVPAGKYTYHVDEDKLPEVLSEYHFTSNRSDVSSTSPERRLDSDGRS